MWLTLVWLWSVFDLVPRRGSLVWNNFGTTDLKEYFQSWDWRTGTGPGFMVEYLEHTQVSSHERVMTETEPPGFYEKRNQCLILGQTKRWRQTWMMVSPDFLNQTTRTSLNNADNLITIGLYVLFVCPVLTPQKTLLLSIICKVDYVNHKFIWGSARGHN